MVLILNVSQLSTACLLFKPEINLWVSCTQIQIIIGTLDWTDAVSPEGIFHYVYLLGCVSQ